MINALAGCVAVSADASRSQRRGPRVGGPRPLQLMVRPQLPITCDTSARSDTRLHSALVSTVRRSRPGANGGFTIVIRRVLGSMSTVYVKDSPAISFGFL